MSDVLYADRVYETSASTGTGSFTLAGAVTGYRTFSSAFGTNQAYYLIASQDVPSEWEVGTYTVSGSTLARAAGSVLASSSGAGTLVNFSAGTKHVFNVAPASAAQSWTTSVTTANTALSTANTANTTANTASSTASTANSTANTANTTANTALSKANTAIQSATGSVNPSTALTITLSKSGTTAQLTASDCNCSTDC